MFTGIIEAKGTVRAINSRLHGKRFEVQLSRGLRPLYKGQSISVNGVCLTVVGFKQRLLRFDVVPQTLRVTNLSLLQKGSVVNIERSLKFGQHVDGHFVLGHVDNRSRVVSAAKVGREICLEITYPKKLKPYLVPKGSIALEGVSLTLAEVRRTTFKVFLIPHTLQQTNLGTKQPRDWVNIEADILLKRLKAR